MNAALGLCLGLLVSAGARAQPASTVDQIPQTINQRSLAASPAQMGAGARNAQATIGQLPGGLAEKRGGQAGAASAPPAEPSLETETLAPSRHRAGSVDADEIARILNDGDATSIDAAAAIASGIATAPSAPREETEKKRLPPPPGLLLPGPPGGGV